MAGVPPLIGFITKRASFEALTYLVSGSVCSDHATPWRRRSPSRSCSVRRSPWRTRCAGGGGRVLVEGLRARPRLASGRVRHDGDPQPRRSGVARRWFPWQAAHRNPLPTETLPFRQPSHGFALWHGVSAPLIMSIIALGSGIALFVFRDDISRIQSTFPESTSMEEQFHRSLRLLDRFAVEGHPPARRPVRCPSTSARSSSRS